MTSVATETDDGIVRPLVAAARRIVVKIGSSSLTRPESAPKSFGSSLPKKPGGNELCVAS